MSIPVTKLRRRASLDGFLFEKGELITTASVLQRNINWNDYVSGDMFLRDDDVQLIKDIQNAPSADQKALLEDSAPQYAATFVKAMAKITVEESLQVVLALVAQLNDISKLLVENMAKIPDVYSVLSAILHRSNYHQFTIDTSAKILAAIYCTSNVLDADFKDFFNWVLNTLLSPDSEDGQVLGATSVLKDLLRNENIQRIFTDERGFRVLSYILKSKHIKNVQVAYNLGFCTWMLTFNNHPDDGFLKMEILDECIKILKSSPREKVARVYLATLSGLSGKGAFNEVMINLGALKVFKSLQNGKSIADEDALSDLESLIKTLEHDLSTMSTFDIYLKELAAGKLHWTQVHTEKFWKENVLRAEENDFAVVKSLVRLLDSDNVDTVAIACYDLGEFVRFYPGGKKIVTRYKGKEKLLFQMSNPAPEVQRQALIAVQKLMVQNWNQLQS